MKRSFHARAVMSMAKRGNSVTLVNLLPSLAMPSVGSNARRKAPIATLQCGFGAWTESNWHIARVKPCQAVYVSICQPCIEIQPYIRAYQLVLSEETVRLALGSLVSESCETLCRLNSLQLPSRPKNVAALMPGREEQENLTARQYPVELFEEARKRKVGTPSVDFKVLLHSPLLCRNVG